MSPQQMKNVLIDLASNDVDLAHIQFKAEKGNANAYYQLQRAMLVFQQAHQLKDGHCERLLTVPFKDLMDQVVVQVTGKTINEVLDRD